MVYFHTGEGLEVCLREGLFYRGKQLQIILVRKLRIYSPYNVDFARGWTLGKSLYGLLGRDYISLGISRGPPIGTKATTVLANIGIVKMAIEDIVYPPAMQTFANHPGQPTQNQKIPALEEP